MAKPHPKDLISAGHISRRWSAKPHQAPSVKSVGITGQMTGVVPI